LNLAVSAGHAEALANALASAEAAGCPQAELEMARAKLKELWRRDCMAVVLRGATGSKARFVNGTYSPTNEKVNGKPVFLKARDPKRCLYMAKDDTWHAATVVSKDASDCVWLACTREEGLAHPTLAKEWEVTDGPDSWNIQPVKTSMMVRVRAR
jgi:hypothetical protein